MKIGIVGNYGHDNNGDEAILQGIINQLVEELHVEPQNIVIFSNNPENTRSRYGLPSVKLLHKRSSLLLSIASTIYHNRKIISGLDLLIIGGGGLLMDMYKRDAPLYTSHALMGKISRCKVIVYGVGAGPIRTKVGLALIKFMLGSAESISVRDSKSKILLQSIGIKKTVLEISDPAIQLGKTIQKAASQEIASVGITAVPYFSKEYWPSGDERKYQAYVTGMAKNIDQLIKKKNVSITFFSTKFPQDVKVTEDIFAEIKHKEKVSVIKDNLYPDQLVSLCQKQDIIIGTRLHSLILSVAAQTPVIGIGYHQKVRDFMDKIGKREYFVDIHLLDQQEDLLEGLVEKYKKGWDREQEDFSDIYQQQQNGINEGINQIRHALELGGRNE